MADKQAKGTTKSKARKAAKKTVRVNDREKQSASKTDTRVREATQDTAQIEALLEREKKRLRNMEWITDRMRAGLDGGTELLPVYTMDIETDPFARGRVPVPFVIGFYDGLTFWSFWTDKRSTCIEKMRVFLEDGAVEPGIVYMHNGGRFDFFYLLDWFEGKTTIINSRIVLAKMPLISQARDPKNKRRFSKGECFEFRDSYAIMPFPLRAYMKDDLPIEYLEKQNREKHRDKIESYLTGDCVNLWELCMGFQREFGDYKTIASAAFAQLSKFHRYDTLSQRTDEDLRGRYYFGGRVQCFAQGVIEQPVQIYDVNSMYPFVMSDFYHPTSWPVMVDRKIHGWKDDGSCKMSGEKIKTFFLTVEGRNHGAFATRMKDGSVEFTIEDGVFHVTIHEYLTALALGLFEPRRILDSFNFVEFSCFHLFVDHFYKLRKEVTAQFNEHKTVCGQCGQKDSISATEGNTGYCATGADLVAHNLYYKYVLNSAYGKFGLNPENYFNWQITKTNEPPKGEDWALDMIGHTKYYVWKQPTKTGWNLKNIGTAASITGAARSLLLRAIARSKGVLYCDTDSIICERFGDSPDLVIDSKKLGAWKAESAGTLTAIAGKKMYAVFDAEGRCVKHANKGVALEPEQILAVARGEDILTFRDAPTFKRDGSAQFVERTARNTVKNVMPAPQARTA